MRKFFGHLGLILRHRHHVIKNGFKCGIGWHCLWHDLSKFSPAEFWPSVKHYAGNHSPVMEERVKTHYFSYICQHHTHRNKHHWEYWVDFFQGRLVVMTMPWVYATEYICDMLSASYCYDPKGFSGEKTLEYFTSRMARNYMTEATRQYILWGLTRFKDLGFKGLRKKDTKAKYEELTAKYPQVEILEELATPGQLPTDAREFIIPRKKL